MIHPVTQVLQPKRTYRTVLDNGMVLIVSENSTADIVAGRIFIRAGGIHERREQTGLFSLLAAVLTKGTEQLSSQEIGEWVESTGSSLGTDAGTDYSLLSFKTVSQDFAQILDLVAQLLRSPTFPEHEVEREQQLILQSIRSMQEQPMNLAYEQLRASIYGDHPYALSGLGTEESILALDRDQLLQAHQRYFRPDQMVVSIAGHTTLKAAQALIEERFGNWYPSDLTDSAPALPPAPQGRNGAGSAAPPPTITVQDTQQSIVMVGYLTAAAGKEDYPALKLISTYLGNGLSSRLFVELREKQGLAYEISAIYPTRLHPSQFIAYLGTAPENTEIALKNLVDEIERLCHISLSNTELETSKSKLLGQYALGKQTNTQIAHVLGWYEILGLGLAFDLKFPKIIKAVSAADIQQVANHYFRHPYVSLLGPQATMPSPPILE